MTETMPNIHDCTIDVPRPTEPRLSDLQRALLACLTAHGPQTTRQLSQAIGRPMKTVGPRLAELREMGVVSALTQGRERVWAAV
jgi:predicted transcriptional regulator